jgi:hypothetical protein
MLGEKHRLGMFGNRELRRIFVPKRDAVRMEAGGNCTVRSFRIFTFH